MAEDTYILTREEKRSFDQMLSDYKRGAFQPLPNNYRRPLASANAQTLVPFHNDSAVEIPAYGLIARTGIYLPGSFSGIRSVSLTGAKTSSNFYRHYLVNGPTAIASSGDGLVQVGPHVVMQYDGTAPAVDEERGPKPGQWGAAFGYPRIAVCDGVISSGDDLMVARFTNVIDRVAGYTVNSSSGSIEPAGFGTVQVYDNTETLISGWKVEAACFLLNSSDTGVPANTACYVFWENGYPHVVARRCVAGA